MTILEIALFALQLASSNPQHLPPSATTPNEAAAKAKTLSDAEQAPRDQISDLDAALAEAEQAQADADAKMSPEELNAIVEAAAAATPPAAPSSHKKKTGT